MVFVHARKETTQAAQDILRLAQENDELGR
jgi:hypothetical protein